MSRRIALVLGVLGLLVLSTPARAADECLELSLDCVVDAVTDGPGAALDDPVGTIGDVVDGTEDTIDPVVDPVKDVVDDVLNEGGGVIDPPVVDPPGNGPRAHESGPGTGVDGRDRTRKGPGTRALVPTAQAREAFVRPSTNIGSAAAGTRPAVAPHGSPGRFEGIIEGAIRGLLLLAVLFGLTVGFVVVQVRLDRNDPKLVAAPVRTEVVTFG